MSDKSFGDPLSRNTVKNPLLSSAVVGLSIEDLTHNAVLLPAVQNYALSSSQDPNTMHPATGAPTDATTDRPVNPTDDFDVNEYIARLQGSRYVSAPINAQLDTNANIEEMEEVNLNEQVEETQSITADIAQNFSQLPAVLPQVASAVFSSLSNMMRVKSREHTPEVQDVSGYQDVAFQRVDQRPALTQPPVGAPSNTYRLPTKKKYAQIPGLSNNNAVLIQNPNVNYFTPNQPIESLENRPITAPDLPPIQDYPQVPLENQPIAAQPPQARPPIGQFDQPMAVIPPPTMFSNAPRNSNAEVERTIMPPSVARRLASQQPQLPKYEANIFVPDASYNRNTQDNTMASQMLYNQSSTVQSVPNVPSVPTSFVPQTVVPSQANLPSFLPSQATVQTVSAPQPVVPNAAALPHLPSQGFVAPPTNVPPSTFVPPPTSATPAVFPPPPINSNPTVVPPQAFIPPPQTSTAPTNVPSQANLPPQIPTFVPPPTSVLPPKTSMPQVSQAFVPPLTNVPPPQTILPSQATVPAQIPTSSPPPSSVPPPQSFVPSQIPAFLPPSSVPTQAVSPSQAFVPPPTSVPTQAVLPPPNVPSQAVLPPSFSETPAEPPKLTEPPKLGTGNVNFRMTKKRPQYYSGPIEGGISSMATPAVPYFSPEATQDVGQVFVPPPQNVNEPFDLSVPQEPVYTGAHQNTGYQNEWDLSRPTTDSFEPPKQDSGFGLIGSLKSKLSAIDINKIQSKVTTFFDPAYNDVKEEPNFGEQSNSNFGAEQSNLDLFVVSQNQYQTSDNNQGYGQTNYYQPDYQNQYFYSSSNTYSNVPQNYAVTNVYSPYIQTENVTPMHSENIPLYQDNIYTQQTVDSNVYPSQDIQNKDISENIQQIGVDVFKPFGGHNTEVGTSNEIFCNNPIASNSVNNPVTGSYFSEPKIEESTKFHLSAVNTEQYTNQTYNTEVNLHSSTSVPSQIPAFLPPRIVPTQAVVPPQEFVPPPTSVPTKAVLPPPPTNAPSQAVLPPQATDQAIETKPIDFFDTKNIPKEENKDHSTSESTIPMFTCEGNAGFFDQIPSIAKDSENKTDNIEINKDTKEQETVSDITKNPTEIKNDDVTPKLTQNLKSPEMIGISPSGFFVKCLEPDVTSNFFDNPTQDAFYNKDLFAKTIDLQEKVAISSLPGDVIENIATSSVIRDIAKELISERRDSLKEPYVPTKIGSQKELDVHGVPLENPAHIFTQNQSFSDNGNEIEFIQAASKEIEQNDLNICETCREVNHPEAKETDLTLRMIENITSPIQLSNPVEVPLTESNELVDDSTDLTNTVCAEITLATEATIETLQVKSAIELLDDEIIENFDKNVKIGADFGWIQPEAQNVEKDYTFHTDPNAIGFYSNNSLFFDNVTNTASEETKADFVKEPEKALPSAPLEIDLKSDDTGLDVNSIEQDANKDFLGYEDFVIEPSETEDDVNDSNTDSFTNRVDKYKSDMPIEHKTVDAPVAVASYFDTGNYAAETHYMKSMSSASLENRDVTSLVDDKITQCPDPDIIKDTKMCGDGVQHTEEKPKEVPLQNPLDFFSTNEPSEGTNRLASYFSAPQKSFFELSQSQDHLRNELIKDLTNIDNYRPTKDQVIKHVNYFTVTYDNACLNRPVSNASLVDVNKASVSGKQAMDGEAASSSGGRSPKESPSKPLNVTFNVPVEEDKESHHTLLTVEGRASNEYVPVKHHWFYRVDCEGRSIWKGFSNVDSDALETAYKSPTLTDDTLVPTDGGRFDVSVRGRLRLPVYWSEKPSNVSRCSWFYKGTTDARYVPYSEDVAAKLEEEYRLGVTQGAWHRRLSLADGEAVVLHTPTVMVHVMQTPGNDAWGGTKQSLSRPRVVRRGHDESEVEDAEPSRVDHLLLLCHGVGTACDIRFRAVEEVVDDFRATSLQLIQGHYRNAYETGEIGRVEVLPVSWHGPLHAGASGVDRRLSAISLESVPRLRAFTNESILDVLLYTGPHYCQTIVSTVCGELNRIYSLFKQRNPGFKGGISLGGHSLGSVILYDLLCNQTPEKPIHPDSNNRKQVLGAAAADFPRIQYPELQFAPDALYALGSPVAMFECTRGIESLGEDFALPTCKKFFNIFHPYDPIAYRIEPLIHPELKNISPFLIPHHKGRKRMHLELKETMARVGADLKQKLYESIKATWSSMWRTPAPTTEQLEKVVEEEIEKEDEAVKDEASNDIDQKMSARLGKLNGGRRIDYVLQEAPFEMINEYLFAISSHVGYWESEDTMLLILREIYDSMGVEPDSSLPQQTMTVQREETRLQVQCDVDRNFIV